MKRRTLLLLAVLLVTIGWWISPFSPHAQPQLAPQATAERIAKPTLATRRTTTTAPRTTTACALPPQLAGNATPLQSALPSAPPPLRHPLVTLRPLAGFSVDARVLSRKDYAAGREADVAPTDLALGWGRMRDPAVLARLQIAQAGRWYHYRWTGDAPLPPSEIVRSSANMHVIPADATIADALNQVRTGDRVRIDGWLVDADDGRGWHWRSSITREDTGPGACEIIYVCSVTRW